MLTRRGKLIGAAGLLALVLSGCSPAAENTFAEGEIPDVSIESFDGVTARLDYEHAIAETPVSEFSLENPDFVTKALQAIAVRTDVCLEDAGHPAAAAGQDWAPFLAHEDRTYGMWSVEYASRYGVDLAPEAGAPPVDVISMGVEQSKEYAACAEGAKKELLEELTWAQEVNIDSQIRGRAVELTRASEGGKAAIAAWQTCMEDEGVILDPADGRPVQQYQEQGKEAEIAAIVIEATCAKSTNAVQALYDVQAKYEAALIDAQAAQVQAFTQKRDEVLAAFDAAIAGK